MSSTVYAEDDYIAISAVQHYLFCPRQCGLIHLEQVWDENRLTAEGQLLHKKVHEAGSESRGEVLTVRGLRICSAEYGVSGIADSVEFHQAMLTDNPHAITLAQEQGLWSVFPVEYKRGKPKKDNTDAVQLCAQALCLEDMLQTVIPTGALYYGKSHSRINVEFTGQLRCQTIELFRQVHEMFFTAKLPGAEYGEKCKSCSLRERCQPEPVSYQSVCAYIHSSLSGIKGEE